VQRVATKCEDNNQKGDRMSAVARREKEREILNRPGPMSPPSTEGSPRSHGPVVTVVPRTEWVSV